MKKVELDESSMSKGRGQTGAAQPQSERAKSAYLSVSGQAVQESVFPIDLLEDD